MFYLICNKNIYLVFSFGISTLGKTLNFRGKIEGIVLVISDHLKSKIMWIWKPPAVSTEMLVEGGLVHRHPASSVQNGNLGPSLLSSSFLSTHLDDLILVGTNAVK